MGNNEKLLAYFASTDNEKLIWKEVEVSNL